MSGRVDGRGQNSASGSLSHSGSLIGPDKMGLGEMTRKSVEKKEKDEEREKTWGKGKREAAVE